MHRSNIVSRLASTILVACALAALAPEGRAVSVTAVTLARQGVAVPGGNGVFDDYFHFGVPCVNDSGMVAFCADLTGTTGGTADDELLLRGHDGQPLLVLAREGETIPGGTGQFGRLSNF